MDQDKDDLDANEELERLEAQYRVYNLELELENIRTLLKGRERQLKLKDAELMRVRELARQRAETITQSLKQQQALKLELEQFQGQRVQDQLIQQQLRQTLEQLQTNQSQERAEYKRQLELLKQELQKCSSDLTTNLPNPQQIAHRNTVQLLMNAYGLRYEVERFLMNTSDPIERNRQRLQVENILKHIEDLERELNGY